MGDRRRGLMYGGELCLNGCDTLLPMPSADKPKGEGGVEQMRKEADYNK